MICQKTITEIAENQSIYCQCHDTVTNHTAPGTRSFTKNLNEVDGILSIITTKLKRDWEMCEYKRGRVNLAYYQLDNKIKYLLKCSCLLYHQI
jgi:hypothetical protein